MADLKVPAELWDKIDDFHKGKIEGILLAAGAIKPEDTLSGDPTILHDPDKLHPLQPIFSLDRLQTHQWRDNWPLSRRK
jgi:hypothetical protein